MSPSKQNKETDDPTNENQDPIARYTELHGEPTWEDVEQECESWQWAADVARENRNEFNSIVKEYIDKRKEIQVQLRSLMDKVEQFQNKRNETNEKVRGIKEERAEAVKNMKNLRDKEEETGLNVAEGKRLEGYIASQDEYHVMVQKMSAEAQKYHNDMQETRSEVHSLRQTHNNTHKKVVKHREIADQHHHDFILFMSEYQRIIDSNSKVEADDEKDTSWIVSEDEADSVIAIVKEYYSDIGEENHIVEIYLDEGRIVIETYQPGRLIGKKGAKIKSLVEMFDLPPKIEITKVA